MIFRTITEYRWKGEPMFVVTSAIAMVIMTSIGYVMSQLFDSCLN